MAKPSTAPYTWATGGSAVVTTIGATKQAEGWLAGEPLPAGMHNWLLQRNGEWLEYLEATDFEDDTLARLRFVSGSDEAWFLGNALSASVYWTDGTDTGYCYMTSATGGAWESQAGFLALDVPGDGTYYGYPSSTPLEARWEVGPCSRTADWTWERTWSNSTSAPSSVSTGAEDFVFASRSGGTADWVMRIPLADLVRGLQSSRSSRVRVTGLTAELGAGYSSGCDTVSVSLMRQNRPAIGAAFTYETVQTDQANDFTASLASGGGSGTYDTASASSPSGEYADLDPETYDYFVELRGEKAASGAGAAAARRIYLDVSKFSVE